MCERKAASEGVHDHRRAGTSESFGVGAVAMKVELFYSPGCSACDDRQAEFRAAAQAAIKDLEWRDINVLDSIDHAVELGVMTLPAIAIDGEVVFTSMPTVVQLRKALIERKRGRM